jgi:uncharacterized Zn finger protein
MSLPAPVYVASEALEEKAATILSEGRLTVVSKIGDDLVCRVRGDHGTYQCGFDTIAARWFCTCPSRGECSHLVATYLIGCAADTD